jgi:iron complex transport system permease protein
MSQKGEEMRLSRRVIDSVDRWVDYEVVEEESNKRFADYRRYTLLKIVFIAVCIVGIIVVMGYSITVGSTDIGFFETYETIWNHIIGNYEEGDLIDYIVIDLRMPRIVAGVIAGAGLAVCGVVMQSTLLNPLADPYTTGVSSGASFGATLAIVANISLLGGELFIVGNAFLFSLIPTAVIVIASKIKGASPTTMIMAGIAIMYIFNAMTTLMMLWADPNNMQAVYIWQAGTLSKANWSNIPVMAAVVAIGMVFFMAISRKLDLLATGDDNAMALGINANKFRIICLALVSVVTAAVVSFTGLIGFIGLVAPHIVRIFVGSSNRFLLLASAAFGSILLIVADLIGRTIISPSVLQVGVVMSFIGGPLFLWLIISKKSKVWS